MGKADFSKAFHEVVALITSFFHHFKPSSSSPSVELYPWMTAFIMSRRCDSRVFLSLFDKLSSVSKEVSEKFRKVADDKKKAFALPHWGDVYCLGDLLEFHKAPKVNESFSRLLDKSVSSSRCVALLEDASKHEAWVQGQIESQSFSLWALASV